MLGAEGIAVGMSTRILPHNFSELLEAQIAILENEPIEMFPDFPTGGIVDVSEYDDGLGKVKVRARIETKDEKTVVIREIPFGTTTESLIASIEAAAQKGKVKIGSIDDFTTDEVEIEVGLARGVYADEVIPQLYAHTDCEVSISSNMVLIKDRRPVEMSVSEVLCFLTDQLRATIRAELELELEQLRRQEALARPGADLHREPDLQADRGGRPPSEQVHDEVTPGLAPYIGELDREVTDDDIERLLAIPIRRISRFDIDKNRRDIDTTVKAIKEVRGKLRKLTPTTIDYLRVPDREVRRSLPAAHRDRPVRGGRRARGVASEPPRRLRPGDRVLRHATSRATATSSTVSRVRQDPAHLARRLVPDHRPRGQGPDPGQGHPLPGSSTRSRGRHFTVVYRDSDRIAYAKKIHIKAFIRDREYELIKDRKGAHRPAPRRATANDILHLDFVPEEAPTGARGDLRPRARSSPPASAARGRRLAPKPVARIKRRKRDARIRTRTGTAADRVCRERRPTPPFRRGRLIQFAVSSVGRFSRLPSSFAVTV